MMLNLKFLALALLPFALAAPSVLPETNYLLTRSLSQQIGIATPDFNDEAAIWATTFYKHVDGVKCAVQLPRVYTAGKYDAAASEQHFHTSFSSDDWKASVVPVSHLKSRWSAYLKLKYCNRGHGSGTCTNFELGYNSGGCQAAPGTNSIVVTYSQNAAVVAWNHGSCTGSHTLFANGCNGGNEQINDETPGTNSFQFIVGCTY